MTAIRLSCLALAVSAIAAACAPVALADDAEWIYDPNAVAFIDLTLSPTAEAELEAEPEEYVQGTFSLTKSSDGTPAGEEPTPAIASRPAEIRLKGSVGGSFREITEKAGFKLKFKAANAVLGLRKMTLNNMVQDPSMVHETLAYEAFRASGVPAPRTGYAYVRLNGEDLGVYLDLENLDNIGLARIFGSFDKDTQHLYEGEYGDDVVPGGVPGFEVDEGGDEPDELGDLEALIEAVDGDGAEPWSERVDPFADLAEMTKMWAVEKYIDHWDGYSGHAGPLRPNNYYLYSDPAGRFQMLPWGTDQAWVFTEGIPSREVTFDGEGGVLFNKCLDDSECYRAYWGALGLTTQAIPALDPAALAEDTADLLAPWQAEERANGRPDPEADEAAEIDDGVEETLDFIEGRQAEAEEWLAENEPPEPQSTKDDGKTTVGLGLSNPSQPDTHIAISKVVTRGAVVTLRLYLPGPGRVVGIGTIKDGKGRTRACVARDSVTGAGPVKLHCRLSKEARHRRHRHSLKLRIRIRFTPSAGSPKTITRSLSLPRVS